MKKSPFRQTSHRSLQPFFCMAQAAVPRWKCSHSVCRFSFLMTGTGRSPSLSTSEKTPASRFLLPHAISILFLLNSSEATRQGKKIPSSRLLRHRFLTGTRCPSASSCAQKQETEAFFSFMGSRPKMVRSDRHSFRMTGSPKNSRRSKTASAMLRRSPSQRRTTSQSRFR